MTHVESPRRPRVVVVGGGFGGLSVVRGLRDTDVDITLVDRHTFNTFQPLLYQVATGSLNPGDITWFLRAVRSRQPNVQFVQGSVGGIQHSARQIQLDDGRRLSFDYLVLATGVTANFFGTPGAAEHSMPLYTREQALALRDRVFAGLEDAAANHRDRDLRMIIVGGGPTGVETAGALAEMRNKDIPVIYPELDPRRVHVTLVEMAPHLLASFKPASRAYAASSLRRIGVDLRLNTTVLRVEPEGAVVGQGDVIPAATVVWASGVIARAEVAGWGLPQRDGGRIAVDHHLRVKDHDRVFAVGDAAIGDGVLALPQLAQPAVQGGRHVAAFIRADVLGQVIDPLRYKDKGILATIGRSSAVAEVAHLPRLQGFPAWMIWNAVHVATLLGGRNRMSTMANLTTKHLAWNHTHNAIVGHTHAPTQQSAAS
ncbi:NAD(P)/FAD-dependent oxidoreductase [Flexivirga oryzae]|uniref:NADH:ubiquinone reductase (non-electrogenic) n=1 Tax=Flexivirga oryzae TaxID=1794944 RepID=A0A839N3X1_9MICO|nr:NAD(P)/FAD-dependent oxidoreductase [Flexivirga oryzae]MBB2892007.1 NADH dehydrogenase [Flexivirga oryzae]